MDSFTTPEILREVESERDRQDEKWGEQDHPSVDPVRLLVGSGAYNIAGELGAKAACEAASEAGRLTWADIAIEELAEAIDAPDDEQRREELVQLSAVAVAWIACIDRRKRNAAG